VLPATANAFVGLMCQRAGESKLWAMGEIRETLDKEIFTPNAGYKK